MPLSFERSSTTQALVVALRGVNQTISYESLARQIGVPVKQAKASLPSARRILREEKIVFGVIHGEGLRRLTDENLALKSEANKKRYGRAMRRGERELDAIQEFEKLSLGSQLIVTTNRTIFSLIGQHLKAKAPPEAPIVSKADIPSNLVPLKTAK